MASSFLPFVADNAKPITVFRALVQRSKGVPLSKLSTIFSVVLHSGLDSVRKELEAMGSKLSSTRKMEQLINNNQDKAVPLQQLEHWGFVSKYFVNQDKFDELKLTEEEFKAFFGTVAVVSPETLTDMEIFVEVGKLAGTSSDIRDLKFTQFDDKAELSLGFTNYQEFLTYVTVNEYREAKITIKPVHIEVENEDDYANAYLRKKCQSPYG